MKSTLKIDYAPNGKPIIKVIQPQEVLHLHSHSDGDYDVRDKLISDFIKSPLNADINNLFQVYTHGSLEKSPDFLVTTIAPLDVLKQFKVFEHIILSRLIPYRDICRINNVEKQRLNDVLRPIDRIDISHKKYIRINEFFNWLNEQEWATWEDQQSN